MEESEWEAGSVSAHQYKAQSPSILPSLLITQPSTGNAIWLGQVHGSQVVQHKSNLQVCSVSTLLPIILNFKNPKSFMEEGPILVTLYESFSKLRLPKDLSLGGRQYTNHLACHSTSWRWVL